MKTWPFFLSIFFLILYWGKSLFIRSGNLRNDNFQPISHLFCNLRMQQEEEYSRTSYLTVITCNYAFHVVKHFIVAFIVSSCCFSLSAGCQQMAAKDWKGALVYFVWTNNYLPRSNQISLKACFLHLSNKR